MGDENIYAYNNMIVKTATVVVTLMVFVMTLVFLLLLFRRRRQEKLHRRSKSLSGSGQIVQHRLAVITEDVAVSYNGTENATGHRDNARQLANGVLSASVDNSQMATTPSSFEQYHFNFDERFEDEEKSGTSTGVNSSCIRAIVHANETAMSSHDIKEQHLAQMAEVESDSDYDATFETTVS